MDIISEKKRILLNEPHVLTATGNPVSFNTDIRAPLKSLKTAFKPVQAGTGDPSPLNIRPISGFDQVTVTKPGENLTVSWASGYGTQYGGYLDLVSGELVVTHYCVTFDGTENWTYQWGTSNPNGVIRLNTLSSYGVPTDKQTSSSYVIASFGTIAIVKSSTSSYGIYCHVTSDYLNYRDANYAELNGRTQQETTDEWKQQVADAYENGTPYQICFQLKSSGYIRYQLTPVQIKSIVGANNISSDLNDNITAEYWTH